MDKSNTIENKIDTEAFERILRRRFSCRSFLIAPVERSLIEKMFGLAQKSPSWCNSQPWQIHITTGIATERFRKGLYAYAVSHMRHGQRPPSDYPFPTVYRGIYKQRQRKCAWQLYESLGIARDDRVASTEQTMENFKLFGAPHVAIITGEHDLAVYGAVDCGVYVGNLLLAAQSLGIAAIPQAAIAGCTPFVREFFDLPESRLALLAVSFGYADIAHPANSFRTERASIAEVVHWHEE